MIKITPAVISFLAICVCFSANATGQPSALDKTEIERVVRSFTAGIDQQDGALIRQSLHEEAMVHGFNADGSGLISVAGSQFADLHEAKRFGGQQRQLEINELSVSEGLQASANIDAFNAEVYYNYRMTLVKLDNNWSILHVVQRSRPAN